MMSDFFRRIPFHVITLQDEGVTLGAAIENALYIDPERGRNTRLNAFGKRIQFLLGANTVPEHILGDAVDPGSNHMMALQLRTAFPAFYPGGLGDLLGDVGMCAAREEKAKGHGVTVTERRRERISFHGSGGGLKWNHW